MGRRPDELERHRDPAQRRRRGILHSRRPGAVRRGEGDTAGLAERVEGGCVSGGEVLAELQLRVPSTTDVPGTR